MKYESITSLVIIKVTGFLDLASIVLLAPSNKWNNNNYEFYSAFEKWRYLYTKQFLGGYITAEDFTTYMHYTTYVDTSAAHTTAVRHYHRGLNTITTRHYIFWL